MPSVVRTLVERLTRENPRWGTGASRANWPVWGTGRGENDTPDPGRRRTRTSTAKVTADMAAVLDSPGVRHPCDFLHFDAVLVQRVYVLFVTEVQTRAVRILGGHRASDWSWTAQQARNLLMDLGERAGQFRS